MKSKTKNTTGVELSVPVIETAAIRLTSDETKALIKVHLASGKPVGFSYGNAAVSLVDLGLFEVAKVAGKTRVERTNELWQTISEAAVSRNRPQIETAFRKFDQNRATDEIKQYVLTDAGKQVARGITIKLNAQYAGK